jgi:hypothetical protein
MTDLKKAAQQALEALEYKGNIYHMDCPSEAAITALKAALAQQEQGPVAWTDRELELIDGMIEVQLRHAAQCDGIANRTMAEKQKGWDMERVALLHKIKSISPRRETEQEPVATVAMDVSGAHLSWNGKYLGQKPDTKIAMLLKDLPVGTLLFTAPPRREWQGLTEEEILLASVECAASHQQDDVAFARAVEARLRELNHG